MERNPPTAFSVINQSIPELRLVNISTPLYVATVRTGWVKHSGGCHTYTIHILYCTYSIVKSKGRGNGASQICFWGKKDWKLFLCAVRAVAYVL